MSARLTRRTKNSGSTSTRQYQQPVTETASHGEGHLPSFSSPVHPAPLSTSLLKPTSTELLPFSMASRCDHGILVVYQSCVVCAARTTIYVLESAHNGAPECAENGSCVRGHKQRKHSPACLACRLRLLRWDRCRLRVQLLAASRPVRRSLSPPILELPPDGDGRRRESILDR